MDLDFQAGTAWDPATSPNSSCFVIAQCIQDVVIRNNRCKGASILAILQASSAGACASRPLCNSSVGQGRGCVIDSNLFIADHDYGETGMVLLYHELSEPGIGDLEITNNFQVNKTPGADYILRDRAVADPGAKTIFVGNTAVGESSLGIHIQSNSSRNNWDVRNNIFDIGTSQATIDIQGTPSGWSADGNIYSNGAVWRWSGNSINSLPQWQASSGGDVNSRQCQPTFLDPGNDDYHLHPADTCAQDQGIDISDVTQRDFENDPRPQGQATDVGADEIANDDALTGPTEASDHKVQGRLKGGESTRFSMGTDQAGRIILTLFWNKPNVLLRISLDCDGSSHTVSSRPGEQFLRLETSTGIPSSCEIEITSIKGDFSFWLNTQST